MLLLALAALTGPDPTPPAPADPLTVEIEAGDAERFAALFERSGGSPSADLLQRDYLDRGSYGVHVFLPDRIRDAAHLAKTVAAKPALYARAIRTCLPIAKATIAELRATYLALAGLFPDLPLPRLYLVVGADNSGGTAGPGAQVLGLETLCRISDTPEKLRSVLRGFYAHETVHALQARFPGGNQGGPLLNSVLTEGAADFIAALATGRSMDPERTAWVIAREAALWRQFEADVALTETLADATMTAGSPEAKAMHRWVGNYGSAPAGWPGEAGYAIGERIWQRWYAKQADKRAALRQMLSVEAPLAVFAAGRFGGG